MSINLNDSNYTLLYIEDDKASRMVTSMFLKPYFKNIIEAEDGIEAIEYYKEKKPDIIISDIKMPKMNGLEFCKKIREEDNSTPIIITTAHTNVEYLLEAVSLNLIKYLGKPLKEEELIEALQSCFSQLESKNPSVIQLTDKIYYDTFNQSLSTDKNIINLSSSQKKLLDILIKNRGRIVSYVEIENYIWDEKYMTIDSLRTLVRKTRKLIGKETIANISKTGYKINIYG